VIIEHDLLCFWQNSASGDTEKVRQGLRFQELVMGKQGEVRQVKINKLISESNFS
jgi:hypothetical protein